MVLEPQISSQKSLFQWPLDEKTPVFYCSGDIVWFVHLSLRFPIYRITHSESFMVPQMVMSILSPPLPSPDEQIPATSRFCQSRLKKPFLPFKLNIMWFDYKQIQLTGGKLIGEVNLVGGGGGGGFCWVCAAGLSEPVSIILVVYSVTKNRPSLSYFWENVIFTIPAIKYTRNGTDHYNSCPPVVSARG